MVHLCKKVLVGFILMIAGIFNSVDAKYNNNSEAQKSALIVYFSHTGNTDLIVKAMQKELKNFYDVKMLRIEPVNQYPGYGDELRNIANKEACDDNFRPAFKEVKVDVQKYDVIFVGCPVWWYTTPKIMISFLENQNFSGKNVRFFVTHAGGPGSCIEDMEKVCTGAKFGENIDIYCNSPGNGTVNSDEIPAWIERVKTEI